MSEKDAIIVSLTLATLALLAVAVELAFLQEEMKRGNDIMQFHIRQVAAYHSPQELHDG